MKAQRDTMMYLDRENHQAARPMKVVVADDGCTWLCGADVEEARDLKEQGCWRCAEVPFTRND